MTEPDKKATRRSEKYIWYGCGIYGGSPSMQNRVGGGYVRESRLLDGYLKQEEPKRSTLPSFLWIIVTLIGLTAFMMLAAWALSVIL